MPPLCARCCVDAPICDPSIRCAFFCVFDAKLGDEPFEEVISTAVLYVYALLLR